MSDKAKEVQAALDAGGFKLVRKNKHNVYRNPEGKTLVTSATPSDVNAAGNQLRDLRRLLVTAAPEVSEATDAAIPRQAKKRAGAAKGSAHVHKWYKGEARPRSRESQQTITRLRGLRETNSYKFISEFKNEMVREYSKWERIRIEAHEAAVRDFVEMWPILVEANQTGIPFDADALPDEQTIKWRVFYNNVQFAVEQIIERDGERDIPFHVLMKVTRAVLETEIRESTKNELPKIAALTNMFARVGYRLLHGESAAEIRKFIAPQVSAIEDQFEFDFRFDFMGMIEEIAATKSEAIRC